MTSWRPAAERAVGRMVDWWRFGRLPTRDMTIAEFKEQVLADPAYKPVFFLSTGRCGTAFFTALLNERPGVRAWHAPEPELIQQGRIAYESYELDRQRGGMERALLDRLLGQVFLAGRESLLLQSHRHGMRFIETNNRISFFAPAIRALIPGAKFVHLHRHPGEFVRSGIRRRWYVERSDHDLGRIRPLGADPARPAWDGFTPLEKCSWLWSATNQFIEWSMTGLEPGRDWLQLSFGDEPAASARQVLEFLALEPGAEPAASLWTKRVNPQREGSFPVYSEWSRADQTRLTALVGDMASRYGYRL